MNSGKQKRVKNSRGAVWTSAEIKRLGKVPDSVLARRFGRTIKEVVAMRESCGNGLPTAPRRWTAREIALLGRFNDAELGRRLRRPAHVVQKKRASFGIPPLVPHKWKFWTRAEEKLIGR